MGPWGLKYSSPGPGGLFVIVATIRAGLSLCNTIDWLGISISKNTSKKLSAVVPSAPNGGTSKRPSCMLAFSSICPNVTSSGFRRRITSPSAG